MKLRDPARPRERGIITSKGFPKAFPRPLGPEWGP
jgi:hypothetical protein